MSRLNLEDNRIDRPFIASKLKMQPLVQTLGAQFAMDADMPPLLFLDPGGAGRDVLLPPEEAGLMYCIVNTADAAETLTVKEDSDTTTIGALAQNEAAWYACDGTTWHRVTSP